MTRSLVISDDGISSYVKDIDVDNLATTEDIINCTWTTVVSRAIGHSVYMIICDDCGLILHKPVTAIKKTITGNWVPALYGTLIITGMDEDGDCSDMTDGDLWTVMDSFAKVNIDGEPRRTVVIE